jgi:uncharacterized protein (DUF2235 family)
MAKNILIFSDGTGQAGGVSFDENRSNIYKLYRATRVGPDSCIDPSEQVAYYDAGLGSRPTGGGSLRTLYRMAHNFIAQATGFGLTTNIVDCYEMIIRLWSPGDRIFLFGFSRGAYTVRCVGGVLAHCGVPTRLGENGPMKYDSGSARRIAKEAVKKVYQHTASRNPAGATPRQNELLEQRRELARQFRQRHGVNLDTDKSNYPFFIGVFDTVAAVASSGALIVVIITALAIAALMSELLWTFYPSYTPWFGDRVGSVLSYVFGLVGFSTSSWWHWFYFVAGVLIGGGMIWYLWQAIKFAPCANPKKWWRTFTMSLGRMRFEDKSLNDNVRYARHAISIDEDRASFERVGWGDPKSTRLYQDEQGVPTFQQYWFAGNHSDIGGSYPETESRLSDIALGWMVETAAGIKGGVKIDPSVLNLYPSFAGMQHDQRRAGFPILTRWLGITWRGKPRSLPNPKATLHGSVYDRAALPAVLQYDMLRPYRPETLRMHERLAGLYKDIPLPKARAGFRAFAASFFLKP